MRIGPLNISFKNEKRAEYTYQQDLGRFISCLTGDMVEQNLINLFMSIPEVFAPIDTIAGAVASAKWELRKIKDDEVVYDNKDWNRLYERPNYAQDWAKLMYSAVVYKYATGNRYIYAYVPDTMTIKLANVVNLWLLPPQYTEPKVKADRPTFLQAEFLADLVSYYDFSAGRDRLKITPEYVSHDTFIDIDRNIDDMTGCGVVKGSSPLLACKYPMSNLMAVYEARNVIYVKRGMLGMMVSQKGDASGLQALTPTEKKELMDDIKTKYGLSRNRDTIAITRFPLDYIKTSMSISELEPFTETDASADAVYGVLRVPRELKPRSEGATFENQKQARRSLYTNIAMPEAAQLGVLIGKLLKLTDLGYYLFPSFEHIEDLQENKKEKSEVDWKNNETARIRFLHSVISLNEWIVSSGYEQVKDKLYDKRLLDMEPTERAVVMEIVKNSKPQNENDGAGKDDNKQ